MFVMYLPYNKIGHVFLKVVSLEWFSIECRKIMPKAITLTNQNGPKQYNYMQQAQSGAGRWGGVGVRGGMRGCMSRSGVGFAFNWRGK